MTEVSAALIDAGVSSSPITSATAAAVTATVVGPTAPPTTAPVAAAPTTSSPTAAGATSSTPVPAPLTSASGGSASSDDSGMLVIIIVVVVVVVALAAGVGFFCYKYGQSAGLRKGYETPTPPAFADVSVRMPVNASGTALAVAAVPAAPMELVPGSHSQIQGAAAVKADYSSKSRVGSDGAVQRGQAMSI